MKYYTDLEGKIPAKVGDLVAFADYGNGHHLYQKEVSLRPIYVEIDGVGGITDITGYGIIYNNEKTSYLEGVIDPPK